MLLSAALQYIVIVEHRRVVMAATLGLIISLRALIQKCPNDEKTAHGRVRNVPFATKTSHAECR